MNLAPPSSQKAADRPISFVLDDQSGTGNALTSIDMVIRPEELTRTSPSRLSVNQTLGGAWADNFGQGIDSIQLSGHTGWRRTEGTNVDGQGRFEELKDGIFTQWHQRRRAAADSGRDPDLVKLVFADALDNFSVVVAPTTFTLRRSKSRPLLSQFQISLLVLDDSIDSESYFQYGKGGKLGYLIRGESSSGALEQLGLTSMAGSMGVIDRLIGQVRSVLTGILGPMRAGVGAFMSVANQIFAQVHQAIAIGDALVGQVIGAAREMAQAGISVFRTISGLLSIPQAVKAWAMGVAAEFCNIYCTLKNAISKRYLIQDFGDLRGASNCSSTAGGAPPSIYANRNPFYAVVPTVQSSPVSITAAASSALQWAKKIDPIFAPPSIADIGAGARSIAEGVSIRLVSSAQTKSAEQATADYLASLQK